MFKKELIIIITLCFSISLMTQAANITTKLNNNPTETFTGFKIQLFTTTTELDFDNTLFIKYQNLTAEKTLDNGFIYSMGSFKNIEEAQSKFDAIQKEFPNAKIIEFVDGKRKGKQPEELPTRFFDVF